MRKFLLGAVAIVVLMASGRLAFAGPPFPLKSNLAFDEKSPYALIVFEAVPQHQVPNWTISVFAFSPETHTWTYGPLSGWARFSDVAGDERPLRMALVKPGGTFAINNLQTQTVWRACFNGGTKAFQAEAGKVTYLGVIDPNPVLTKIASELPHEVSAPTYLFDTPRLVLTPPSEREDWQADLSAWLAKNFPKVRAPLVAAAPMDTTFTPGKSLLAGKLCEKY